jgi:NAD(P)-dependent dehydrogenase (short-subunit alcohol dehydrogenase family)
MFRRLIDINLTGSFLMSQTVGKAMMAAGKPGSIVLVASMSGSIVNYPQEQSCYNASKAGVIQFGKSLGAEWAKYNIRVNCISPGMFLLFFYRVHASLIYPNELQVTWTLLSTMFPLSMPRRSSGSRSLPRTAWAPSTTSTVWPSSWAPIRAVL